MTELKPCPFCGGEASLMYLPLKIGAYVRRGTYYVHCKKCLIATQYRRDKQIVIDIWNGRTTDENN